MVSGGAKVPPVNSMWRPGAADSKLFVSAIKVKEAMDLDVRTAEKGQHCKAQGRRQSQTLGGKDGSVQ